MEKKIRNDKKNEYFLNSLFACIYWKKKWFVVVVFMSIIIEHKPAHKTKSVQYGADPTRPGECAAHEWQCDNRKCINSEFLCDQQQDCTDNSDEIRGCLEGKIVLNSVFCIYILNKWVSKWVQGC